MRNGVPEHTVRPKCLRLHRRADCLLKLKGGPVTCDTLSGYSDSGNNGWGYCHSPCLMMAIRSGSGAFEPRHNALMFALQAEIHRTAVRGRFQLTFSFPVDCTSLDCRWLWRQESGCEGFVVTPHESGSLADDLAVAFVGDVYAWRSLHGAVVSVGCLVFNLYLSGSRQVKRLKMGRWLLKSMPMLSSSLFLLRD